MPAFVCFSLDMTLPTGGSAGASLSQPTLGTGPLSVIISCGLGHTRKPVLTEMKLTHCGWLPIERPAPVDRSETGLGNSSARVRWDEHDLWLATT